MMHQCLIQWDGDEVEVVHADDSIEISLAAMSVWDAEDQEPILGINLEGSDHVVATKNGVRLVLSPASQSRRSTEGKMLRCTWQGRPLQLAPKNKMWDFNGKCIR
jgi:hypothetical protein